MSISKVYLVAYNVLQCIGWSILMFRLLPHIVELKPPSLELYASLGGLLRCCQTAAYLEFVHAATGKVSLYLKSTLVGQLYLG